MSKNTLFENLGICDNTTTLQNIQSENDLFDSMYVKMCSSQYENAFRERTKKMFEKSKDYLDNDFDKEFKLKGKFNARLRELYMASFLIKKGYHLDDHKPKKNSPDIKLSYGGKDIWIECVASTKGEGDNGILNITNGFSGNIDKVNLSRKLRLTTVLDVKMKKFNCYILDKRVRQNDCCIVAVNGGESDGDFIVNGIGSILFGCDKIIFAHKNGKLEGPYVEERKEIENKNGAIIDHALFLSRYYDHISGIIYFGSCIVDSRDFNLEGISENSRGANGKTKIQFIKNPNAKNKIPDGFLKNFEIIYNIN